MNDMPSDTKGWYPSKWLNYVIGLILATVAQLMASPPPFNVDFFLGGLAVQLALVFILPLGIARLVSDKGQRKFVHGWALLGSLLGFGALACFIATQH